MYPKSVILLLAALSLAFYVECREIYNAKPVEISAGTIAVDSLPANFSECRYHLRIDIPRRCNNPKWSVTLQYADSSRTVIELCRPGTAADDYDYGLPLEVKKLDFSADSQSVATERWQLLKDIDPNISAWSLTLTHLPDDAGLTCAIGQRNQHLSFPVKSTGLRTITATSYSNLKLARLSLFTTETDNLTDVGTASIDELSERLHKSSENIEGFWRYLDRDTDPRKLNTGGDYKLATLIAPDGSVEILYLGGAVNNSSKWQPLMLKGRLLPTAFINHYDLVWYDAFGAKIDFETSADLIDGAILRLNFPLHGGSIRFQKDTNAIVQPVSR